jgi:hypothetical protein
MFCITKNILYAWLFLLLNKLLAENYASENPNILLFPSQNTIGIERENSAATYIREHPNENLRISPIYLREDLSNSEIHVELGKLPRQFKYISAVYLRDGIHEIE